MLVQILPSGQLLFSCTPSQRARWTKYIEALDTFDTALFEYGITVTTVIGECLFDGSEKGLILRRDFGITTATFGCWERPTEEQTSKFCKTGYILLESAD